MVLKMLFKKEEYTSDTEDLSVQLKKTTQTKKTKLYGANYTEIHKGLIYFI
jgi:hypothetical protein